MDGGRGGVEDEGASLGTDMEKTPKILMYQLKNVPNVQVVSSQWFKEKEKKIVCSTPLDKDKK